MASEGSKGLSRRRFVNAAVAGGIGLTGVAVLAGCGGTQIVTETKIQEVIKEVPVEKIVTKEVIKEVLVEKIVQERVEVPVEVEKVVIKEVIKEVPAQRETVTVRWQEVWADVFQDVIEDKMIPGFEKEFPYIKIENERIEQAQMYEIYLSQIAGGDPPDVIMISESRVPQFAARQGILPLDPFIGKAGLDLAATFYAGEWPKGQWLGVQYSLPLDNTGAWYLFWWDKDAFEEVGLDSETPPTTWAELEEMALKVTVKEGDKITRHGMFVPEMAAGAGTDRSFKAWHFPAGGDMFTEDAKTVLFDDEIGLRNASWQYDMVQKLNGGWENVIGFMDAIGASRTAFYNGKLTMRVEGVWFLGVMRRDAPDINAGVTHLPFDDTNPTAKPRAISDDGWSYAIPTGVQNLEEAWEWLQYLTAGEGNLAFMGNLKRPSSVPKYNDDPIYQDEPLWGDLKATLSLVEASPITPVHPDIDQVLKDEMELLMARKKSPAEAVADMASTSQKLLDEYFAKQ